MIEPVSSDVQPEFAANGKTKAPSDRIEQVSWDDVNEIHQVVCDLQVVADLLWHTASKPEGGTEMQTLYLVDQLAKHVAELRRVSHYDSEDEPPA